MRALLVIDWQKEYIDKNSGYYVNSNLEKETSSLNEIIIKWREKDYPVIFIRHNETEGENFLKGSKNAELQDALNVSTTDYFTDKHHISSFYKTNLEKILEDNQISELYICGILTNLCVRSAISDAYDRGFNIKVIKDLCISFNPEIQTFTIEDIKNTRPEVKMISSSEI